MNNLGSQPRGIFHSRLVFRLCCLLFALSTSVAAQLGVPAPLPPAAQEAVNKGVIAAKVPDYLLAIRYFEEARKIAPDAPVIYLNLGLAESKIPGRELRAIAWFGAYLAAYPAAPNSSAVKDQISRLAVQNQSNVTRLLKKVQESIPKFRNHPLGRESGQLPIDGSQRLSWVAELWAKTGDFQSALRTADLIQDAIFRDAARRMVAQAQAENGDIRGAMKTSELIRDANSKNGAYTAIAVVQAEGGDIAAATKTALLLDTHDPSYEFYEDVVNCSVAIAQAKSGDVGAAMKTLELIRDRNYERSAREAIAVSQAKSGDFDGARRTANLIRDSFWKSTAQAKIAAIQADIGNPQRIRPIASAYEWLRRLDDRENSHCPLNTYPFLDLAGYLESMPPTVDPEVAYKLLFDSAEKLVDAQEVIHQMLKQQGIKL